MDNKVQGFYILFLSLIAFLFFPFNTKAKIYIDISTPYIQKLPIGLEPPELTVNTYENRIAAAKLIKCLTSDLLFQGFFSVYNLSQDLGEEKLDYIVKTQFQRQGAKVVVTLKLFDLADNSMLVGKKYIGTLKDLRRIAHRFSNEIVLAITGQEGVTLSRIVFISETPTKEIFSADFDGQNIRQETRLKTIVMSPRYSPDGRYIAFISFKSGRPCLYLKDNSTGKIRKIVSFNGVNMSPAWHPSGKKLALALSKSGSPDLYLIDINGNIIRRLTYGTEINCSPSFSPDGEKLVFVSDRSGTPQLFILELSTGHIRRLTYSGSYNTDPQWSPNGDKIAYVSRINGRFQIFTISPEGGDPVQLTYEGSNENPSWSPDGRQIVYSSTRIRGQKHLFVMLANGQNQRLLLSYGHQDYFPYWGPNNFK